MGLTGYNIDGNNGEQGVIGKYCSDAKSLPRGLNVEVVGFFTTGIYGKSAAEIV